MKIMHTLRPGLSGDNPLAASSIFVPDKKKNSCMQPSLQTASNTITEWLNVGHACKRRLALMSHFLTVVERYT